MNKEEERALLDRVEQLERARSAFRFKAFIREWSGPTGGIIAVVASLIAGLHFFVQPDIRNLTADVSAIRGDITRIDGTLNKTNEKIDGLLSKALDRAFPSQSGTTKDKVRSAVQNTRDLIELSKSVGASPTPHALIEIGRRAVSAAPENPEIASATWRLASESISYASELTLPNFVVNLPACPIRSTTNRPEQIVVKDHVATLTLGSWVYQDCVFVLDRPAEEPQVLYDKGLIFKHCLIRYAGGPLRVIGSISFENCLFDFIVKSPPPAPGVRLAGSLLASNLTHADTRGFPMQ